MSNIELDKEYFENIRGAVYVPAQAYNAYQTWKNYSREEAERDIQYAVKLKLNAFRLWVSYEYWLEDANSFKASFEHFIESAAKAGILTMPSLFEDCGRPNTIEAYTDRTPATATAFKSPGTEVTSSPEKWEKCKEFVIWFMDNYGNDERLLAIEVMNEPHIMPESENLSFARAMFKTAREHAGNRPLTIGCIALVHNLYFMEYGLDILQYHDNFPTSVEEFEKMLNVAEQTQKILGKPVWITEWQRIRKGGAGWHVKEIPSEERVPDLSSLTALLAKYKIGNFFWSLMLKPAYLPSQRLNGTINGIFHEDGSVYSLEDAQAVAGDTSLKFVERRTAPLVVYGGCQSVILT